MRRLRCLLGGHEWASQVPDGVTLRYDEHRVTCARCGAGVTVDAHRSWRPDPESGGLRQDPDRPWSWGV
jgi:hypothetical protein